MKDIKFGPTDQFNMTINVGDLVTYPVRKKSDMWMSNGTVIDIFEDGTGMVLKIKDIKTDRSKTIRNIKNVTIVRHIKSNMLDDWAQNKVKRVDELELENESLKETLEHLKDQHDVALYCIKENKEWMDGYSIALEEKDRLLKEATTTKNIKDSVDTLSSRVGALIDDMVSFKSDDMDVATHEEIQKVPNESSTADTQWFKDQGLSDQDMMDLCIVDTESEMQTDLISKYEAFVERTSKSDVKSQTNEDVNNRVWSGMALAAEVGELLSMIKKIKQGKLGDMWYNDLVKEFGDVMWYLTKLMLIHDTNLNEVLRTNMDKLSKRFGI